IPKAKWRSGRVGRPEHRHHSLLRLTIQALGSHKVHYESSSRACPVTRPARLSERLLWWRDATQHAVAPHERSTKPDNQKERDREEPCVPSLHAYKLSLPSGKRQIPPPFLVGPSRSAGEPQTPASRPN